MNLSFIQSETFVMKAHEYGSLLMKVLKKIGLILSNRHSQPKLKIFYENTWDTKRMIYS